MWDAYASRHVFFKVFLDAYCFTYTKHIRFREAVVVYADKIIHAAYFSKL